MDRNPPSTPAAVPPSSPPAAVRCWLRETLDRAAAEVAAWPAGKREAMMAAASAPPAFIPPKRCPVP